MTKYMVAVTEIIEYLVPIEADNEDDAAEMGIAEIIESGDRDKYFVSCRARECDGVNEAYEEDMPADLSDGLPHLNRHG